MVKKIVSLCCMAASIVLMALPYGIPMTFMPSPEIGPVIDYYSYFSMMPFGYGNWFPLITALLSIVTSLLIIVGFKMNLKKSTLICLLVCMVASVLSWVMANTFTVIGVIVFLLHIITFVLQAFTGNKNTE